MDGGGTGGGRGRGGRGRLKADGVFSDVASVRWHITAPAWRITAFTLQLKNRPCDNLFSWSAPSAIVCPENRIMFLHEFHPSLLSSTPPLLLPPISKTMLFSPSLHFLFLNLQFPEKLIQNHTAFPKQNAVFRRRHRLPSFINPPLNSGCGPQRTDMSLNPSSPRLTRPVWPICLFCRWIKPRPAGPWSTAEFK